MDRLNDRVLGWVQLWVLRCRKNVRYSLIEELTRLISWKQCFVLYLYISVGLFFMGVKFKIRLQLVRIYIYFFLSCTPTCNRYKNVFTDFKRSIWKKDDGNIFYFRIFYEIIEPHS